MDSYSIFWQVYFYPALCVSASAAVSAATAASIMTVVVRFADADAAAYYIATAGFIGVSRRTRCSDAASNAASYVNETNKS
ncbi:hypothetical protein YC2023_110885 [Brassica napus]